MGRAAVGTQPRSFRLIEFHAPHSLPARDGSGRIARAPIAARRSPACASSQAGARCFRRGRASRCGSGRRRSPASPTTLGESVRPGECADKEGSMVLKFHGRSREGKSTTAETVAQRTESRTIPAMIVHDSRPGAQLPDTGLWVVAFRSARPSQALGAEAGDRKTAPAQGRGRQETRAEPPRTRGRG